MTTTDIRTRQRPQAEPTAQSLRLAELDAEIAAVKAKLDDPHGWGKELRNEHDRLLGLRADLVALTATTVLAA